MFTLLVTLLGIWSSSFSPLASELMMQSRVEIQIRDVQSVEWRPDKWWKLPGVRTTKHRKRMVRARAVGISQHNEYSHELRAMFGNDIEGDLWLPLGYADADETRKTKKKR